MRFGLKRLAVQITVKLFRTIRAANWLHLPQPTSSNLVGTDSLMNLTPFFSMCSAILLAICWSNPRKKIERTYENGPRVICSKKKQ